MKSAHLHLVLLLVIFTGLGDSVPHEYCLEPFNGKDCQQPPVPVFYYYKPGSRCEIKMWRGCPTMNKFPDEFLCSHYCIGKLWGRPDENEDNGTMEFDEDVVVFDEPPAELIEELNQLDIPKMEEFNEILDNVIQANHPVKLSLVKTTEATDVTSVTPEADTHPEEEIPESPPDTETEPVTVEEVTTPEDITEEPPTDPPAAEPETTTIVDQEEGDAEEVITT